MTTAPCKYCAERHDRCFSTCEKYAEYRRERNEEREKRRAYYDYEAARASQTVNVKNKLYRKYGRRK